MDSLIISASVALGIGLAIGLERERSQAADGSGEAPAGLRTFALVSLSGAASAMLSPGLVLPAMLLGAALLTAVSYHRSAGHDSGLTTEFALLLTLLLGALAVSHPELAAALATVVVLLLHGKPILHHIARRVVTREEMSEALILATAALIVWPLLPDRYMGPLDAWNPHAIWLVVLLVLLAGAVGHICARLFGDRLGLPISGLFGGFVSSTATIAAMAVLSRKSVERIHGPVAAALLSSVATYVQMLLLLGATSLSALAALALPLAAGLAVIAVSGGIWLWRSWHEARGGSEGLPGGRTFDWRGAAAFAVLFAVLQLLGAATQAWAGNEGLLALAIGAGFADAHAAATSIGSMVGAGKIGPPAAVWPVLGALTANTVSKIVASAAGGARFALPVAIGLVLSTGATWAAAWLQRLA
ncbi:MgtC/SapB family protein [Cupriavidus sp. TMH.W2]|uniref:MgtC/SapB family protein n=1 Tax=Cupriavidus sp. TMH.W2 TaxID=3434465 RepID=UPI003D773441